MSDATPTPEVEPADFVRAAWSMVKAGPVTVVLRLISDFATNVLVWTALFAAIFLGVMALVGGPDPRLVVGAAGMFATLVGAFLALDAVVFGTVWAHARRTAVDGGVAASSTRAIKEGFGRFGDALLLRSFNFAARLAIASLFASWAFPLGVLIARNEGLWGSAVWLPAAIYGVAATLFSLAAGGAYLTIELTGPSYIMGNRSLGGAISEAASLVLERPIFIYRVFVTALSVLIPALMFAWAASIAYALTLESPEIAALTGLLRTGANLVLFAALGLFAVMVQFSFFAYYAHRHGLRTSFPPKFLDGEAKDERPIPIEELIPKFPVHRVQMSAVLAATRPPERHEGADEEE